MVDKKKRYVIPEAELIDFANEDIITISDAGQLGIIGEDPDKESF